MRFVCHLWAATALVFIAGCSGDTQAIRERIYVKQEVPASLLSCAPWPAPDTLPTDVRGLVEWLARAKAAHVDCAYKLNQVRGIVDSQSQ